MDELRGPIAGLAASLSDRRARAEALAPDLQILAECRRPRPLPPSAPDPADAAAAILGELREAESAADAASNEACGFAPPTSLAEAEAAFRRATDGAARTRTAVARGRGRLAELERLAAAPPPPAPTSSAGTDPLAAARERVESALDSLSGSDGLAATHRARFDRLRELAGQARELAAAAAALRSAIEQRGADATGVAEAVRLEGAIRECATRAARDVDRLEAPLDTEAQAVAAILDRARTALAACPAVPPSAAPALPDRSAEVTAALAEARALAGRLESHAIAADLCAGAAGAAVDRWRTLRPPAGGSGWVGGSVKSVSSGGAPPGPPAGGGVGPAGAIDAIVVFASPEQCRYVEALAIAEQLAARQPADSVEGRWLAEQLPRLRDLAQDQRIASSSLAQALAAARADDPRGAREALKVAKRRALGCQVPAIDQVDDQLAQAEEARRQADRTAFSDAMAGLLPTLIDVYNRGVAAQSPPPSAAQAAASSGGGRGCDDPAAARTMYAGMDWQASRFLCSCPGYEFDPRQGVCVHTGRSPSPAGSGVATGGATGGGGGSAPTSASDWAIVRVDRRWSETAAFCGGAQQVAVAERNVTLYIRGRRDGTVAGWQEVLRREDARPGVWVKSGPCTCRRAGSGSVSLHRDNLTSQEALAVWENEIKRLPGSEVDFGVWLVPGAGDNARSNVETTAVCSLLG
jgi:hypothetical protein